MKIISLTTGDQQDAIAPHAATHHEGGVDPITPEAIGAETEGATAAAIAAHLGQNNPHSQYLQQVSWGIISGIPASFPPSQHRINHRYDNFDSITPIVFNSGGFVHGTYTDFNALPDFGFWFVQGTANGPNTHGSTGQYYVLNLGLGNNYSYAQYAMQLAIPRNKIPPIISIRFKELGVWGAWGNA